MFPLSIALSILINNVNVINNVNYVLLIGKFWFCCLSLNHKHFLYGECEEDKKPNVEHLPNKCECTKQIDWN